MSDTELTDEEAQQAKDTLTAAIRAYRDTIEPGCYVDGWVLITHNLTTELEAENSSMVSVLVPTEQSFVLTRGLLDIALDGERS